MSVDLSGMSVADALATLGVAYRVEFRGTFRAIPRRGSRWSLAERRDRLRNPVRYGPHLVVGSELGSDPA